MPSTRSQTKATALSKSTHSSKSKPRGRKRALSRVDDPEPNSRSNSKANPRVQLTDEISISKKPAKRARASTMSVSKVAEPEKNHGEDNVRSPMDDVVQLAQEVETVSDGPAQSDKQDDAQAEPKLSGTFDLYGMDLPFLHKIYAPDSLDPDSVFPEALYKTILIHQAKRDRTAQLIVPEDYTSHGKFISGIFRDPMEELPFNLVVYHIEKIEDGVLKGFESGYKRPSHGEWNGAGVSASLEIENGGCGILFSRGSVSMRPMWRQMSEVDEDGGGSPTLMELFEGTFSFEVKYNSVYSRKGHGNGQGLDLNFWAVRAKE